MTCAAPAYRAEIVRLIHGDARPGAPGHKEEPVRTGVEGERAGHVQTYPIGSAVAVPDHPALRLDGSFTLCAWIFPTLPHKRAQGLIAKWSEPERSGYALVIDAAGALALRIGADEVSTGAPLRARYWYFVAAAYDARTGTVRLEQRPHPLWPLDASAVRVERALVARAGATDAPLYLGAWAAAAPGGRAGHYNGKLEAPAVYGEALDAGALDAVAGGSAPVPPLAAWDLARGTSTRVVHDVSGNAHDGRTVNLPARGMTGHAFAGGERDWKIAPETHGAIHFHDDDLEDCEWEVAFELDVPGDLPSGVYAAKLTADELVDHVPFFVRPRGRRAAAPVLFLVPTNSYLAYANFRERFAEQERVLGLYHLHEDGSGVFYSSARRPIINLRPGSNFDVVAGGSPHQFNADLHLVDWLAARGHAFDVATDADLHAEGDGLLSQYRVVLTGSHPEYWSDAMLDALGTYLGRGGRLMYLGGNGLIWVTSFDPERNDVVEVRRGGSSHRAATPGEHYHSTTGEFGGYWRARGRAPNRSVGVGSIAQGFDRSAPYRRTAASSDPRASWIFDGVAADAPIGDHGLVMGGAAGFEIDAADPLLGTPPHALVIATATELSPTYEHQDPIRVPGTTVDLSPPIRADMVFFETPNGGAVFSVGSIAYCGALSHAGYENDVSRITENVLRRFAAHGPVWR